MPFDVSSSAIVSENSKYIGVDLEVLSRKESQPSQYSNIKKFGSFCGRVRGAFFNLPIL